MSHTNSEVNNTTQADIALRDLQALLRKSIGDEVEVVSYETTNLLPKGENYGSTMLKVDAVIKRNKNAPQENLPLVAKMIPISEFQRRYLKVTASFAKEIYVFEKLVPSYRELERDAGIEEKKIINILPKFYGGRLTLNKEKPDEADEDAVMLMENIKVSGYYTDNRKEGLDLNHAKIAIRELARFHALGMALKYKHPEEFNAARTPISALPFELADNEFDDVTDHILDMLCADPRIAKYADRVRTNINADRGWKSLTTVVATEPWVTITHGDFWVNNIMFHKDNSGNVDDVKFVDFQLSNICSPLRDLPYFLCGSTAMNVLEHHLDELLDIYYKKFIEVLKYTGCDTSPFTRKAFDEQLKKDARGGLFHCLMALKFFTFDASEDLDLNDMKGSVMMADATTLYLERSWRIISAFVEKEWL